MVIIFIFFMMDKRGKGRQWVNMVLFQYLLEF